MCTPPLYYSLALAITLSFTYPASANNNKKYAAEFYQAIELNPDLDNGQKLYRNCISCHGPEGWGTLSGSYPQIAGQLKGTIIKQLADFRALNRDNPLMQAFTSPSILGGAQDIADVAGYIANLPMTNQNDKGPQYLQKNGEAAYNDKCKKCHGKEAEGDPIEHVPALHSQHFNYLLRQFEWIRTGRRRNADPKMVKQIKNFHPQEEISILSHTSKIPPPAEKLASPGWKNPDFPSFIRSPYIQ